MMNSNNRADRAPSDKKVWQHIQIAPDPFVQGQFYSVQELLGAHVWDDEEQDTVFVPAELPAATRVVLMKLDETGFAKNVYGSYNGLQRYKS